MRFSRRLLLASLLLTPVAAPAAEAWPAAAKLDAYFDALQKNQLANGSLTISSCVIGARSARPSSAV